MTTSKLRPLVRENLSAQFETIQPVVDADPRINFSQEAADASNKLIADLQATVDAFAKTYPVTGVVGYTAIGTAIERLVGTTIVDFGGDTEGTVENAKAGHATGRKASFNWWKTVREGVTKTQAILDFERAAAAGIELPDPRKGPSSVDIAAMMAALGLGGSRSGRLGDINALDALLGGGDEIEAPRVTRSLRS